MRLKSWESPRSGPRRNDKSKQASARLRQLKKRNQQLRKRLKSKDEDNNGPNNSNNPNKAPGTFPGAFLAPLPSIIGKPACAPLNISRLHELLRFTPLSR